MDKILILDFGSQYTQLIARRVREIGVYCELWAWDVTEEQIKEFGELDQLSKKLIVLTEKRIKHCNHVKVEIKNLSKFKLQNIFLYNFNY
mgnify:CR=1 FL=1